MNMVKYARIIFEEEIPEDATAEDALVVLLKCMKNAQTCLKGEDVEISEAPYERME
jgi:hypothetical protein